MKIILEVNVLCYEYHCCKNNFCSYGYLMHFITDVKYMEVIHVCLFLETVLM